MNIVSARRFGLWTKLFRKWMKRELDTFSGVINASATKNKQEILEAIAGIHGEEDEPISTEEMDELLNLQ